MSSDTLIALHAIFRHGERTPDKSAHYPNDPYFHHKYEPYGYGQLTNEGKKTMYELGKLLRNTYDNYLGGQYKPEYVEALSTNVDRTKASLQLVLAGLFPPRNCDIWNEELNWQPIPYNVDNKFLERITNHPEFLPTYNRYYETEKGQKILEEHREFLAYMKKHLGQEKNCTLMRIWQLIAHLTAQQQFGLKLPEWANSVFPDKITNVGIYDYYLHTATKELRKMLLGNLLEKILNDIKAKLQKTSERKIHLYSAHDYNPAHILIFFNAMFHHSPNYGACIVLEVHDFGTKCGIKLKYKESKFVEFRYMIFTNGTDTLDFEELERMIRDLD